MLDLLAGFEEHQQRRNLSRTTIITRRRTLRQFAEWLHPSPLFDATPGDIEAWLDGLPLSPRSRYLYISSLTAFYDWTGEPEPNPARKLDRPKLPKLLPRPWADDDFQRALDKADERMAVWLLLAGFQGFRCHEIAHMRREDVLEANNPPLLVVSKGKGDRQRILPAHDDTMAALDTYGYRSRRGWLFPSRTGNHYSPATVSHYIWAHLNRCGVAGSAHQGRHWFGTHLYAESRDLRLTQEMMGHSDPKTTAIYTRFSPTDAATAIRRLSIGEAESRAQHPTALGAQGVAPARTEQNPTVGTHQRLGDDARPARDGGHRGNDSDGTRAAGPRPSGTDGGGD